MSYLPLARKYRPQTFEELIGQPHVTTTLARALENKRIAQAYLFAGSRGVGKTSAARVLAKCLNCHAGPTPTPCNTCASCTQITQGNSLDVIEIDGASHRGIDEIRSLRETVPFAPSAGAFRVYIIDEVHMLTTEAFNALLKTLEEPPAHVKFIFATTAPNKIPATILSRCQRFDFRRLEAATVVEVLKKVAKAEKIKITDAALFAIARACEGGLRDAEVILDQLSSFAQGTIEEAHVTELLGALEWETLVDWVGAILTRQPARALALMTEQLSRGKDALQLLSDVVRHIRNLAIISSTAESDDRQALFARLIDEPAERLQQLEEQARLSSPQELTLLLQITTGAYELMRRSPMAQTILELVVIKLATREQWQSLDDISRRLEQLKTGESLVHSPSASPKNTSGPTAPMKTTSIHTTTPTATESSTPQAAPAAAPIAEDLAPLWSRFLERLSSQKMSLAAYLMEARPLQLSDTTMTVGLPGFALHHEVLSLVEHRKLITALLSELLGRSMAVEYTTLPADAPAATERPAVDPSTMPPMVQDIVKLFNATVDQPRPAT